MDAEQGTVWGRGAYQRLEMMRMVCWRVGVHSVSWGSFSIRSCKSQVKAESFHLPGPVPCHQVSFPPKGLGAQHPSNLQDSASALDLHRGASVI